MAIISCPECGRSVSDRAVSCPDCGCPISAAPAVVAAPQVDTAKEVEKLTVLARRAREASDSKNAKKYYDQILDKDPGNWEAIFYSVYFEAVECKIRDISSAANSVANSIYSTFAAIADLPSEDAQDEALATIISSATSIALVIINGAVNHYNQFSTTDNAFGECANRVVSSGNIYGEIESSLKKAFPDKQEYLAKFQGRYITFMKSQARWYNSSFLQRTCDRLDAEIAKVHPEHGRKRELEKKIETLTSQANALKTERKPAAGCLGYFLLIVGFIMLFAGLALMSMDADEIWPILVAVPELLLAMVCLKKKPSQREVNENQAKKAKLNAEIDTLRRELNNL